MNPARHTHEPPYDPSPSPGLRFEQFRQICANGFGDGHNSFAHSAAWFKGCLYVGTTRSNLCMLKLSLTHLCGDLSQLSAWPVECPATVEGIYELDRRAQIWRYSPLTGQWQQVYRSPLVNSANQEAIEVKGIDGRSEVIGTKDALVPRDIGYRGMTVFQGESDPEPVLYVATWAPRLAPGPLILRSDDGITFVPVSDYGVIGLPITSLRSLTPFQGRLFIAPTGSRGGKMNVSAVPVVYESSDPSRGQWRAACEPGFGELRNESIFSLCSSTDWLYAGTFNCEGFQVWRTDARGDPPYHWSRVLERGAGRGPFNQIALSMAMFKGALYVGSGIQNGGYDRINNIGPAAPQLIRLLEDGRCDLIIGNAHENSDDIKEPLSGLVDGFGNSFNGYFWRMAVHDDWLYLGTYESSGLMGWIDLDELPHYAKHLVEGVGVKHIMNYRGFELWRSWDGENWLPVDRKGFNNPFNCGVRNLISSPAGLFVGTANPFGPRIATRLGNDWVYEDNPKGGLEVWLGKHSPHIHSVQQNV